MPAMVMRILKITVILLVILAVFLGGSLWMLMRTGLALSQRSVPEVQTPDLSALIGNPERGAHLARSRGCADCHGDGLHGRVFMDNRAMGRVVGNDLTPSLAGLGPEASLSAFDAAVRHGRSRAGTPIFLMPSQDYWHFSDQELVDLWAYVRSLPPSHGVVPQTELGPIAKLMLGAGQLSFAYDTIDHARVRPTVPDKGPTTAYGRHLANLTCIGCHGKDLSGGKIPGGDPAWPPASDLRPTALSAYTLESFTTVIRTGRRADGRDNDPAMPRTFAAFDDVEIRALWEFLSAPTP
jgi:cytochrome c553